MTANRLQAWARTGEEWAPVILHQFTAMVDDTRSFLLALDDDTWWSMQKYAQPRVRAGAHVDVGIAGNTGIVARSLPQKRYRRR
jgi:hypothetical protein